MTILSQNEKIALYLGIFLSILIIFVGIFFSSNSLTIRNLIFGISAIIVSVTFFYTFILQSIGSGMPGSRRYHDYSKSLDRDFRPTVIPPPQRTKKMVMKSTCQYCGKSALMGFTCSYCDYYFCSEHRLPEKHNCIGLKSFKS